MKLGEIQQHVPVKIIGLIAEKRHGKDTTAEQLIASGTGWQRLSFADPLYAEVAEAFGLEDESLLRDDATKDTPQDAMALMNCSDREFVRIAYGLIDITDMPTETTPIPCVPLSPRQVLQWWGKEYRRAQDPLYWIKPILPLLVSGAKYITTDIRFDTEIELVEEHNGVFVHVERPGRVTTKGTHESDTNIARFVALCSHKVVNRENDLDGLRQQIEAIAATL